MQRLCDIEATVARCSFPEWVITVKKDDKRPYLQVGAYSAVCNVSGHPLPWSGHKWFLSYHMTTSEIVQTAFKAVMTAVEHEAASSSCTGTRRCSRRIGTSSGWRPCSTSARASPRTHERKSHERPLRPRPAHPSLPAPQA